MLSPSRSAALALLAIAAAALSCRRAPVGRDVRDAGTDGGGASVGDAARADAVIAADVGTADAPPDLSTPGDAGADALDAVDVSDAGPTVCPAGVTPVDVCGCGCCGDPMGRACYYPSLGQTRDGVPNPPGQSCTMAGCSAGVRHMCCADPGPDTAERTICAIDTSIEDLSRFTITRRDGDVCTTLALGSAVATIPITGPPGYPNVSAWRAPCDGTQPRVPAIGGLGQVTPGPPSPPPATARYDVHVVLFFDAGTGIADAVRIDRDGVELAPHCTSAACPPCGGTCALDATYRFTTTGGLAPYRDMTVLAPPASYSYHRRGEAVPAPEMTCAPAFPACGGPATDVADVMSAFLDADVQAAFALAKTSGTAPFYGDDQRGGDAPASAIQRDTVGFLIGAPCPAGSTRPCMAIPPGLTRLLSLLRALDQQQLADASCAFARP